MVRTIARRTKTTAQIVVSDRRFQCTAISAATGSATVGAVGATIGLAFGGPFREVIFDLRVFEPMVLFSIV